MATPSILRARGDLIGIGGGLERNERPLRLLYAFPHVVRWLDEILPELQPFYPGADLSPIEQIDDLFHDFVSGADLSYYRRTHAMTPGASGIWELKTLDARIFGWFYRKGVFIAANVDSMHRVKSLSLYAGYRDDAVFRRNKLDLDPPKFITGEYGDVL